MQAGRVCDRERHPKAGRRQTCVQGCTVRQKTRESGAESTPGRPPRPSPPRTLSVPPPPNKARETDTARLVRAPPGGRAGGNRCPARGGAGPGGGGAGRGGAGRGPEAAGRTDPEAPGCRAAWAAEAAERAAQPAPSRHGPARPAAPPAARAACALRAVRPAAGKGGRPGSRSPRAGSRARRLRGNWGRTRRGGCQTSRDLNGAAGAEDLGGGEGGELGGYVLDRGRRERASGGELGCRTGSCGTPAPGHGRFQKSYLVAGFGGAVYSLNISGASARCPRSVAAAEAAAWTQTLPREQEKKRGKISEPRTVPTLSNHPNIRFLLSGHFGPARALGPSL